MKNEYENDLLHLAMNESNGMFAWHFFGVMNAVHEHGLPMKESPRDVARDYLETFHADALAEAENNVEKVLDATL